MVMKTILYKFQGEIEGKFAFCNVCNPTKHYDGAIGLVIPSEFCNENNGIISIEKKVFKHLEKSGLIEYKY